MIGGVGPPVRLPLEGSVPSVVATSAAAQAVQGDSVATSDRKLSLVEIS